MNRIVENGWKLQQRFEPNRAIYERGNERRVINTRNGEVLFEYKLNLNFGQGGHQPSDIKGDTVLDVPPARHQGDE